MKQNFIVGQVRSTAEVAQHRSFRRAAAEPLIAFSAARPEVEIAAGESPSTSRPKGFDAGMRLGSSPLT
jgi:hypothetical protein